MSFPNEVTYDSLPPIGYPNTIKIQRFLPNTNSIAQPGDIIRFNISTPGYWDPYTAYINLEVDLSEETTLDNYDILQIDSSASSFISEFIATCKGGELERITEYDVLANFLNDVSLNNEQRQCRDIEGLGHNTRTFNKRVGALYPDGIPTPFVEYDGTKGIWSTDRYTIYHSKPWVLPTTHTDASFDFTNASGLKNLLSINSGVKEGTSSVQWQKFFDRPYLDDTFTEGTGNTRSVVSNSNGIGGLHWSIANSLSDQFSTCDYDHFTGLGFNTLKGWDSGIPALFNNDLSQGCFEPFLSKGMKIPSMFNGRWQAVTASKRQFCIPLLSGIFGALMPRASYKFMPMIALEDLVLEFRLNPFAMFTSGYKIYQNGSFLATGDSLKKFGQIPRKWRITKFEICVEMLYFDKLVDNIVLNSMNSENGLNFHTTSWYLGPQYTLSPGSNPQGTYQLNLGFESLKTLILMFLPQEYLKNTFMRKLYRVNCGITSIQLRIGMELYPSLPLKGHAGTSSHYSASYQYSNNAEYLISLQKSFQKFQNKDEDIAINSVNFAVNQRYWNPYETIDDSLIDNTTVTATAGLNYHLISAMPLIHENRCKGKALFCLDLESMSENPKIISGLNTLKNKPFEILLTSDSNSYYFSGKENNKHTEHVQMYIWCQYDMVVQLKKYGVKIMGKGSSI